MIAHEAANARKRIDALLSIPHQSWLLGAGVSFEANIPLMGPLTDRVETILKEQGEDLAKCYAEIRGELSNDAHVEHILSHLGDLIAIANRTKRGTARVSTKSHKLESLTVLHSCIQEAISNTIRWGFRAAKGKEKERIGDQTDPIVKIDDHRHFVRALFGTRRAGLDRRPPVAFFTTNYDTLLEDALSLERIRADDGFHGGAMAFWDSGATTDRSTYELTSVQAKLFKLHGSIDWFMSEQDVVVRRRDGAPYPPYEPRRLLIYPQATKYQVTQRDPFASLFSTFRSTLNFDEQSLLAVCGYSFGDEHINEEIERALRQRKNRLTLLIFAFQPDKKLGRNQGLPERVVSWLSDSSLLTTDARERIVVAGRRGIYHGSLENLCPCKTGGEHPWWTFRGVASALSKGTAESL